MKNTTIDTDVLIVGAGPVGLFLANECSRRGLRWRLIEARATQSEHSKALAVMPRTLEIFDMAGLVAPFLEVANRVSWATIISHKNTIARMHFTTEDSPYPFIAMIPQDVTEKLLVEELHRKGGAIDYETRFVSAIQNNDHVNVIIDRRGEQSEIVASFVVGCDGAHSTVRHHLGLSFEGGEYEASFMLADIETNETLPKDEMQLCPSEFGPLAIFPMSTNRRRVVATIEKTEGEAPSLELVRSALAQRGPSGIEAHAMQWSSYFRIHHRQVKEMRIGRIFVAGDAAHVHSPFGGQGMNTGLHDVWNLIWKINMVLRGYGNEQLLDSYTAERYPVIKSVVNLTHFMTKAMATPSKFAQAVRDTVIPIVSRLTPFQHAFVQRLSQLGIAYSGSPIIEGAGKRFFDDSIRGGKGIGSSFLLFIEDNIDASTINLLKQIGKSHYGIVELRSTSRHGITLVRPDGYIAYTSNNFGVHEIESLHSVLDRHIK